MGSWQSGVYIGSKNEKEDHVRTPDTNRLYLVHTAVTPAVGTQTYCDCCTVMYNNHNWCLGYTVV